MCKEKFSVLMSVYYKEKPNYLEQALKSIFEQTLKPTEVILVEDGKLTEELYSVVEKFHRKFDNLKIIKLNTNSGLGNALNIGLNKCNYEYVFRMDTDDICRKDRFEIQMKYMLEHPNIDVLGTNIYEFQENINENMRKKIMPTSNNINSYILKRNPLNHMTVCFKKSSVLECGGYQSILLLEDYYLWVRMFKNNKTLENLNQELVYARIGNGFERRRGNKNKINSWKKLEKYMLDNNMINKSRYLKNLLNVYLMVYSPNFIRKFVYKFIFRSN